LLTLVATSINATEGTIFNQQVATFSMGDVGGTFQNYAAFVNWGDGSSSAGTITPVGQTTNYTIAGTHTYLKEGTYPLSVVLNGTGSTTQNAQSTAIVGDAIPVVTVGPFAPTALASFSGTVATFTDPGPDMANQYLVTINWGDSTSSPGTVALQSGSTTTFNVSGTHTYATSGAKMASVTVTDLAGTVAPGSKSITVADPVPSVTAPAFNPLAGIPFTNGIVATFTDADPTLTAGSFAATINWGDNSNPTAGTITSNGASGFNVTGTHTYNTVNDFVTTITVFRLPDNQKSTAMGLAVVNNPVITPTAVAIHASTGLAFTGPVATFVDTNPAAIATDFTANIVWGDGHSSAGQIALNTTGGFNVIGTNTYVTSNMTYPVQVTITRTSTNQTASVVSTATVSDAALSATVNQGIKVQAGQAFNMIVGTITDGNASASPGDYSVTIAWGDGSQTTNPTITYAGVAGQFNVRASHTYAQAGSDLVTLVVTRKADGVIATASNLATVTTIASLNAAGTTITPEAGVAFTSAVGTVFLSPPPSDPARLLATIAWGDGQSSLGFLFPVAGNPTAFFVVGTHTYGTTSATTPFTITVNVTDPSALPAGPTSSTLSKSFTSFAQVVARPFSGGLAPLFDTGTSSTDGITRINMPTFAGSAQPYSLVQIYTQLPQQLSPVFFGVAIAGADGSWSVPAPRPLADGHYSVFAVATPASGSPVISVALQPITIDTVQPVLVGASYSRAAGQITLTYFDSSTSFNPLALTNPALYQLTFKPSRNRHAPSVTPQPITAIANPSNPGVVTLNLSPEQQAALRGLRIISAGVTDLAGNTLAGGNRTILFAVGKGHPTSPPRLARVASHPSMRHKR
jgi:hypothetical protein